MQILNLVNRGKSDIIYTITKFPDGEPHIVLKDINRKDEVFVICRITNPDDLFILMQVGDILNRQGVIFSLKICYLMSMRMDRVISYDEAYSLNIVANIINSIKPTDVVIVEPHSHKSTHLIDVGIAESGTKYAPKEKEYIYVYPDAGAEARYHAYFLHEDHVYCSKIRSLESGNLLGFSIKNPEVIRENPYKPLMLIDDLCDGGGTFVGIANELRKIDPKRELNIYVTHMVNIKGIINLSNTFNHVWFTNSYKDWKSEFNRLSMEFPGNVTQIDIL